MNSSQTGQAMTNEATNMANNIGQKFSAGKAEMLKLIEKQQEEARKLAGQLKGVTDAGARRALGEYNKQIANLKATHAKMTEGNVQGDALTNLKNGLNKSKVAAQQAVEKAKQAGKSAAKFTRDVAKVAKNPGKYQASQNTSKAQGKVKGGPMSQTQRFGPITSGGRKRRTRRKRRRKGKKSRRSRRRKRKGRKSRRSRRRKRKGRKSRRSRRRKRRRR